MDGAQIDHCTGRYPLASLACCVAQATSLIGHQVATAAQNEPEEVVVNGSRLRQNPLEMTAPLRTATAADIERSGALPIADDLQRRPISGSAINRSNSSSGSLSFPPAGGMRFFHARAAINF